MRQWLVKATLWLGTIVSAAASNGQGLPLSANLPLEGYFRPGKYMPVHLVADAARDPQEFIYAKAPQSVWTFLGCESSRVDTVVPLMPMGSQVDTVTVNWGRHPGAGVQLPLHLLAANQALVGFAGAGISAANAAKLAKQVDGRKQWIAEQLDMWQPITGAATAWEALDLLVLDQAAFHRIDARKIAALVSGGVSLMVQSDQTPDAIWPWEKKEAGWWSLRYVPAGPDATYTPAAYDVVPNFKGGLTQWDRWRVVVYGLVLEAIILLLALIGRRWVGIGWGVAFSFIALSTIIYLGHWQRSVRSAEGTVEIVGSHITQDDTWAFQTSISLGFSRLRWVDGLHLVIASPDQWPRMDPRVVCYPTGTPDVLEFNLLEDRKVAVFARRCGPSQPVRAPSADGHSPMRLLAADLYMKKGDRIMGERPGSPILGEGYFKSEMWPTVVIQRAADARP